MQLTHSVVTCVVYSTCNMLLKLIVIRCNSHMQSLHVWYTVHVTCMEFSGFPMQTCMHKFTHKRILGWVVSWQLMWSSIFKPFSQASPVFVVLWFAFSKYTEVEERSSTSVYYTECKPKNKKCGRPGNKARYILGVTNVWGPCTLFSRTILSVS